MNLDDAKVIIETLTTRMTDSDITITRLVIRLARATLSAEQLKAMAADFANFDDFENNDLAKTIHELLIAD